MPSHDTLRASIIIVIHNGRPYLEECLTSLRRALLPDTEVIAVDNGSTDGSAEWVRMWMPQARLVVNAANRGFAAAALQGAAMARGEILVFLNQDTRVEPGWLRALLAGFREPSVGLVTSTVLQMDNPERIQSCGQNVHYTGLVFGRGFGEPRASFSDPAEVSAVSGASFAIRRDVWEELGGFSGVFYMYYEETDLSWRARQAGYRSLHVQTSVLYHAGRTDRPSPMALYYSFRNRTLMLLSNWEWTTLLLLLPGLLLAEILEWGLALARGWAGVSAKARAVLWVFTHGGTVGRLHARARRQKRLGDGAMLASLGWRLEPRVITGGKIGRRLIALWNALFYLNWRLTLALMRMSEECHKVSKDAQGRPRSEAEWR